MGKDSVKENRRLSFAFHQSSSFQVCTGYAFPAFIRSNKPDAAPARNDSKEGDV